MHSLKTFSEIAAVMLVSVTVFGTGCERPAPLSPPAAERSSNPAPAAEATYSVIGDCARATVIDPGTVSNVARGTRLRREHLSSDQVLRENRSQRNV